MEAVCKYCNEVENKQEKPGLICLSCKSLVHLTCLKRQGTPGDFTGDVFFDFACVDCSANGEECFVRNKMPWVNVLLLTLHHLHTQSLGISHQGFFHYKTHIGSFIDRNWQLLFGNQVKQKKNWMGTIAGTLSVYRWLLFRSGSIVLGEAGWWKLQHKFSPALAAHIITETAKDKPKGRPRGPPGLDRTLFYYKIRKLGYMDYVVVENDAPPAEPVTKKARLLSETQEAGSSENEHGQLATDIEPRSEPESMILDESYACLAAKDAYPDVDSFFSSYDFPFHSGVSTEHNDSSSEQTTATGVPADDSDSRSSHTLPEPPEPPPDADGKCPVYDVKVRDVPAKAKKTDAVVRRESQFSTQLNSVDLPWVVKEIKAPKDIVELTEYEEIQLLKQVDNLVTKMRDPDKKAYLCRLRAKLALRRLKRHKHLPIFDLDKTVKVLGGYVMEMPKVVASVERVLDRFQRSYLLDSLSGTIPEVSSGTVLLSHMEPTPLRSPYSGAVLKPYIRRDFDTQPLWLQLMDELLRKTNRHIKDYEPPPRASLDYSYVRPQHIPALNNLCAQFFWPGIDLTEALQQPEHSCVVSYGRLAVGCAFLTAGARDAYVSFVLARPAWRRARLASFMLYHLLQVCGDEALQQPEHSCVVSYGRLAVGCAFLTAGARDAYVSFVLARPAWRRARLASFMLYHLLQVCGDEALQQPEHSCVVSYGRLAVGCAFLTAGARDAYVSFVLARPAWRRARLASFMLYHLLQVCGDEALQQPEHSCVVSYGRLAVGCAFLTAGARDAYVSFVLARPAWRRARLASFMLYHLLQVCGDEALQQPEHSCVVSYGRLAVGCAFLTAGARDAYVSFVLARPAWRRARLASFMLYHLLQTCPDKDVTLHVSPTNPAIFLYQKFGFKVEELVQDFYEKYYDIDHKGCRHALFLRLVR
ncbi:cysteine-rich protein 2-binding protein [Epargyreus clarus]|uniref:cysteine-rich protein 2-binding protein n=1 Tax=Epargyreus clarus TaxID=520877 RepID=UPI003C309CA5